MEQIYFVKDNPAVSGTSSIRAKGYEAIEYIRNDRLLERLREIAKINENEGNTALFVIC